MQNTVVKGNGKCPILPWMVEFHSTADGKIMNNQLNAAFAENYLEHLSKLHEKSKVRRKRLTQFVVIIPPNVQIEDIEAFLIAGMTVAQIRLDYFTAKDAYYTIDLIKKVNEDFGKKIGRVYPLAIALDLSEPEIVTGKLQQPYKEIEMEKGQTTKVLANPEFANRVNKDYIYVNYENISNVVKPGDSLILGDNNIHMSALQIARDIVECIVDKAGKLVDNLSVKLPNIPIDVQKGVSKEKLVEISSECQVDMIFVGPGSIDLAKQILGPSVLVFVKVEYASTADDFDHIIDKADGILVDGDKLMMTSKQNVFLLEKSIIASCNKKAKPVVTSVNCNSITKAQVSDIANIVIDGTDALLLPPDAALLESICLICKSAEGAVYQKELFKNLCSLKKPPIEPIESICMAAVEASFKSNAAAIILITTSGRSAKLISRYRPRCPIIALTRLGRIAKQLMVYKGVIPIYYVQNSKDTFTQNIEKKMQLGMTFGKVNGYIKMGDAVVMVFGLKNYVGFRNCLEVVYASQFDTVPEEDV
ncbi:PK domain containing protein [Asbolus verrucosus]|uniref:Pyruvate kinase n=1 Tax=Asbolus verrucosus TaxID=1661398 RepID=A0A482VPM4_ASBVE|nr:PK domain containing protein [Asbolus verrucosus]